MKAIISIQEEDNGIYGSSVEIVNSNGYTEFRIEGEGSTIKLALESLQYTIGVTAETCQKAVNKALATLNLPLEED